MDGVFFQQVVKGSLRDRSHRVATGAQIAHSAAQDIFLGHAMGISRLLAHPLLRHVSSGFGVLLACSYGVQGRVEGVLFGLENQASGEWDCRGGGCVASARTRST